MQKFFNWMLAAILICGTSVVTTSCGGDDEVNQTPNTPQEENTKFTVYASVTLDRNLAEFGYLVATYTYKDKEETIQLKKGDNSDQFPTANNFGSNLIQYLNKTYGVDYTSNNFIVRNVVIKDLDRRKNENAVFKIKFVVDPQHPEVTEESNRTFVIPDVMGYTEGGFTMIRSNLSVVKGVHADKFEDWLSKCVQEVTITFGPSSPNE